MGNPSLLVLDEPATGLDFIARESLLQALEQMYVDNPDLAVIYVTHFVEEITPQIDKGLLLKNGVCYKAGPITEILNDTTLSEFFNKNVKVAYQNNRYALFSND